MKPLTSNAQLMMERTVSGLWSRQMAILDNIANAETPGYKTKYVTFEDTLKSRLRHAAGTSRPRAAAREALEGLAGEVHEAQESARMDDNGVNVTEQSMELVRVSYQMQYAMQAAASDMAALRSAIKGQ